MPQIDPVALRVFVYDEILARGLPPKLAEIGANFGTSVAAARRELAELRIGKTILVDPRSGEIWMAGPFAAGETPYRLVGGNRAWWANCAWDMFGVAMIVSERLQVDSNCGDCGDPIAVTCDPSVPPEENAVVHFLLPARQWYEDIRFT